MHFEVVVLPLLSLLVGVAQPGDGTDDRPPTMSVQSAALVHHSYMSDCDLNIPVTIAGELVRVAWVNPHVWIAIKSGAPAPATWWIQADAPYALRSRGWTSASLTPHIQVAASGYAARRIEAHACGCELTLADGHRVVL